MFFSCPKLVCCAADTEMAGVQCARHLFGTVLAINTYRSEGVKGSSGYRDKLSDDPLSGDPLESSGSGLALHHCPKLGWRDAPLDTWMQDAPGRWDQKHSGSLALRPSPKWAHRGGSPSCNNSTSWGNKPSFLRGDLGGASLHDHMSPYNVSLKTRSFSMSR